MFGARLKIVGEKEGMLQRSWPINCRLPSRLSAHMNRGSVSRLRHSQKIADCFNTSTDYLLGRTDDPSPRLKIETIAAHRHTDDPMTGCRRQRKSVEEFIDFVYKKYGKKEE